MVQDAAAAELASRQLRASGLDFELRRAADEASFREALRGFRPHVILSDYALPGLEGVTALEIARRAARDAPFIFLSAPLGEERAIEAMRRGAADCVLKSSTERLVPAIERAIEEAAKRRRKRAAERRIRRREQRLRAVIDTAQQCDPLTGLANRALYCRRLDDRLRAARGPESTFAVAAFDVHNLRVINDTQGRQVGDALLQTLAARLKAHVDDEGRIGYLGGGTFALVVPWLGAEEENAARLLESAIFIEQFAIEGRTVRAAFRCGIACSGSEDDDGGMLVQKAEAALAEAKRSGETLLLYRERMHREMAEQLALEHRLRIALDESQFELYYQPQIELATGRIRVVEALLRWHDPERGVIAPGEFLPVLESSGLIVPVGRWVLEQAVESCRRWRAAGIGPIRVGVNVSALQLRRRAFVEQTLELLARVFGEPGGIEVEITETALLQDFETSRRRLERLREAGVRIAIDDFGTGYSSLALLPSLPIDALKIDRSFIQGLPDDRASVTLVSSIIGLARAFGLEAVAEGVETAGQLEVLRALACTRTQGFLHGRPVPADEIERILLSSTHDAAAIQA
ncbi:MAG TPA: GGDEF domain-containing response regulator [Steroidobacteraceae bacterium]|nr:GGDEF domain-containing response regulator [Steroidobacteraceae bacterium]